MAQDEGGGHANVINLGSPPPADLESPSWLDVQIDDEHFMRDLNRLKDLRSFLMQEAVNLNTLAPSGALSFGRLNLLRYKTNGRAPTQDEWGQVEYHTQTLFGLLSEPMRRKFILGGIPTWMSVLPIAFALIALISLIFAIFVERAALIRGIPGGANILPFYLVWLMSLGAIGAVAFIGMNALSVQEDITFDLTNKRLMLLRVSLGALFGLVLTLPFGFKGFVQFCAEIAVGSSSSSKVLEQTPQALMLLLPFVLGFSTSLVILVLNRLVDAVQSFFGKGGSGGERQVATTATAGGSTSLPSKKREVVG